MNYKKIIPFRIWTFYIIIICGQFHRSTRVCLADTARRPNVIEALAANTTDESENSTTEQEPDEDNTFLVSTIMYVCMAILVLAVIGVGIYLTRLSTKKVALTTERSKTNDSADLAVQEVRLIATQQQLKVLRKASKSPEEIIRAQSITGGSAKKTKSSFITSISKKTAKAK